MTEGAARVLVVTGPIGAGKTTVTQHVGSLLAAHGVPHAVIDMDWLRDAWPQPADDPFNTRIGYRNLAAVARNFEAAGCDRFVVADVVETRDQCREYAWAIPGATVTVVRLAVEPGENRRRIAHRAPGGDDAWEIARAAELVGIMATNAVADIVVDTTGRSPDAIAREILLRVGWLDADPERDAAAATPETRENDLGDDPSDRCADVASGGDGDAAGAARPLRRGPGSCGPAPS